MNGELTKIEDIAPIIKFLGTGGWWITGQTIFANGGYTGLYGGMAVSCTILMRARMSSHEA